MASLEIEEILKDPDSRLRIVIGFKANATGRSDQFSPRPVSIVGFNQSGFNISVSNQYNNPLENDSLNALNQTGQLLQGAVRSFGRDLKMPVSLRSALASLNNWVGSERPVFNLNFYLIAYKEEHNILNDIRLLNQLFYPVKSIEISGSATLAPPLGYLVNFDSAFNGGSEGKVQGTVSLSVGKWFTAHNLNPVNMSYEISLETLESGAPLYAQVNVSFTPHKILSVDDIQGYLRV